MESPFTTDYESIVGKIEAVNPLKYAQSRNYVGGDITYLSPYISRGVISTKQVLESLLAKGFKIPQIESFVKELCWRDYFQRVGQVRNLNEDIKQPQQLVSNVEIPTAVVQAQTGIIGIDNSIKQLYASGYMHNHCRMYTASMVCNIAKSHWFHPAQWMYYHLLDGDWASNACNWQWVAGSNSNKKYFANQENINRFTFTNQSNTLLDTSYEALAQMETPASLLATKKLVLETTLPESELVTIDVSLPTFIYNYYNLDPLWHKGEAGNRILLLEPDFFKAYPISKKCVDFMMVLRNNIEAIQVYVGSFDSLIKEFHLSTIYYKEHPLSIGYTGNEEQRDWIAEDVLGYFPSFFSYWKKIEKRILADYDFN
jgi:deoxyribodipyrimidine photo-lyase